MLLGRFRLSSRFRHERAGAEAERVPYHPDRVGRPAGTSLVINRSRAVLGVSADYHDSAAALLVDGRIVAAAAEERFSRTKHDASFPRQAIRFCLQSAELPTDGLSAVAYYEKPFNRFERMLGTHARLGPRSLASLRRSLASFARRKLWVAARVADALEAADHRPVRLLYAEHHLSHAASAFYPSPFERAAILTCDGVGEETSASIGLGESDRVRILEEMRYPSSVGLFYAALTEFCGFEVNDGESKLMGLAPYGEPRYVDALRDRVVDVSSDGSIRLDLRWFSFERGRQMTSPALADLLDGPRRDAQAPIGQREADIAASAQAVLEDVVLRMCRHARDLTGADDLCMAGGVALNCVANARVRESGIFDDVWVQPAPGDDGGAVGAALWAWHQILDGSRAEVGDDAMSGAAIGPAFDDLTIAGWLADNGIPFERHADRDRLGEVVAEALARGCTVGWFQGPMEFGPRALGHRSILADPRDPAMISRLNGSVKRRESFRPFAPVVLQEHAAEWFELDAPRPYMVETVTVRQEHRRTPSSCTAGSMSERLASERSSISACTHIDHTARVQTVDRRHHPEMYAVLAAFHSITGCPVLVNTSFNRRDEPIVCTPADALRCFLDTDLDLLVLEGNVVRRSALDSGVTATEAVS